MSKRKVARSPFQMEEVTLVATTLDERWEPTPAEGRYEMKGYQFGVFQMGTLKPFTIVPTMKEAKLIAYTYHRTTGFGVEVKEISHGMVLYLKLAPKERE